MLPSGNAVTMDPVHGYACRMPQRLALAGIRDQHGRMLSLAAARQRVERCRKPVEEAIDEANTKLWAQAEKVANRK